MSDHARHTNITKTLNVWNIAFKAYSTHNNLQFDPNIKQDGIEEINNCLGGGGFGQCTPLKVPTECSPPKTHSRNSRLCCRSTALPPVVTDPTNKFVPPTSSIREKMVFLSTTPSCSYTPSQWNLPWKHPFNQLFTHIMGLNSSSTLYRNAFFEWTPSKQILPEQACTISPERFYDGSEEELKMIREYSQHMPKLSQQTTAQSHSFDLQFAKEADVFSCGCVIAEIFTGYPLFTLSTLLQYKQGSYYPTDSLAQLPHDIAELVKSMIDPKPSNRLSIEGYLTMTVDDNPIFPPFFQKLHQIVSIPGKSELSSILGNLMTDESLGILFGVEKTANNFQASFSNQTDIDLKHPPYRESTPILDDLSQLIRESEVITTPEDIFVPDSSSTLAPHHFLQSLNRENELQSLINVVEKLDDRETQRANQENRVQPSSQSTSDHPHSIRWPIMSVAPRASSGLVCSCDTCAIAFSRKGSHSAPIDWLEWEKQSETQEADKGGRKQGLRIRDRIPIKQQSQDYISFTKQHTVSSLTKVSSPFSIVDSIQHFHCSRGFQTTINPNHTVSDVISSLQQSNKPEGNSLLPPNHPEYLIYIIILRSLFVTVNNLQLQRYGLNLVCALSPFLDDESILQYVAPALIYLINNSPSQTIYNTSFSTLCYVLSLIRKEVPGQIHFFVDNVFPNILPSLETQGAQQGQLKGTTILSEGDRKATKIRWEGRHDVPLCIEDDKPPASRFVFSTNYAALASHFSHLVVAAMRFSTFYEMDLEYHRHRELLAESITTSIAVLVRLNATTRFIFLQSPQTLHIFPTLSFNENLRSVLLSLIDINEWPIRVSLLQPLLALARTNQNAAIEIVGRIRSRLSNHFEPIEFVLQRDIALLSDIAMLLPAGDSEYDSECDQTICGRRENSLLTALVDCVDDVVWFVIHPNAWIRNEAVLFITRVATALGEIDSLLELQPSVIPFLDPLMGVTVPLDDLRLLSSALIQPISRFAYRTVLECLIEEFRNDQTSTHPVRLALSPAPSSYILKSHHQTITSEQKSDKVKLEDSIERAFRNSFGDACLDFLFTSTPPMCDPDTSSLCLSMAFEQAQQILSDNRTHRRPALLSKLSSPVTQNDLILLFLFRDRLYHNALASKDISKDLLSTQHEYSALSEKSLIPVRNEPSQLTTSTLISTPIGMIPAPTGTSPNAHIATPEWALKLRQVQFLNEHSQGITSLSKSHAGNNNLFISCASDGFVRLWDLSLMRRGEESHQSLMAYKMASSFNAPNQSLLYNDKKQVEEPSTKYHATLLPDGTTFCYGTSTASTHSPGVLSFVDIQSGVELLKQLATDSIASSETDLLHAQPYSLLLSTGTRQSIFPSFPVLYNGVSCVKSFLINQSPMVVYANTNGYIHVIDPRVAETVWVVHMPSACGRVTSLDVDPNSLYFVAGTSMGRISLVDIRFGVPLHQTLSENSSPITDIVSTVSSTPFPSLSMAQLHPSFSAARPSQTGYPLVWAATGLNRAIALSPSEGLGICGSVGASAQTTAQISVTTPAPSQGKMVGHSADSYNLIPEPSIRALVAPTGVNCLITAGSDKIIRHWNWSNDGRNVSCTRITRRLANCSVTNESTGMTSHIVEYDNNFNSSLLDDQANLQGYSKQDLQLLEEEDWSNHKDCITSMILINDRLVSGGRDGSIIVWGSDLP
ncbi:putative phosphoinositide-3-kinase, regulatory subunit 4 [Blattamonas nauphoetae]|uniref:non-specific serine/threonine protein kinase n=1 Tax=Blattamonas nauphoetae TaxID=2049346 RepID=A0ABQ9Y4L4_9EUKA|nr:putative phosphoinositide-3-kinase, regulatory subunit 4 [Blattamonas nauphoetae]